MPRRSALRASDADREYIAERLKNAAAEGRIGADELEHRLEAAFSARTYGELGMLVSDLPRDPALGSAAPRVPVRLRPATVAALVIAFPIALAIAAAAIVAIVALLSAWAIAVGLAALVLGTRARALPRPWSVGSRRLHGRHADQRVLGSFTPWH